MRHLYEEEKEKKETGLEEEQYYDYDDRYEEGYGISFKGIDFAEDNDFSLVPSKYIEFVDGDSGIDFDTEMKRIQKEFKVLIKEEKQSQEQIVNAFKTLGYEL